MKLNNGNIFRAKEPLQKLLQERLPVKTAYALAQLAKALNDQLTVIELTRAGLFQTYGTPNEKNIRNLEVLEDNPNRAKFLEEMGTLMTMEVEVVLQPVVLPETVPSTCDSCKHNMDRPLEIDALTLMLLDGLVSVA